MALPAPTTHPSPVSPAGLRLLRLCYHSPCVSPPRGLHGNSPSTLIPSTSRGESNMPQPGQHRTNVCFAQAQPLKEGKEGQE